MQQRLEMYKRLMSSKDFAQLFDVEEEIRDRYGKLPQEAQNIVALAELKLIATQLRITQIKAVNSTITLVFDATSSVTVTDQQIKHAVKQAQKRIRQISPQELTVELTKVQKNERISHIKDILLSFQ
jgi:transcription-repair coupling factor (superfamily II helicase)